MVELPAKILPYLATRGVFAKRALPLAWNIVSIKFRQPGPEILITARADRPAPLARAQITEFLSAVEIFVFVRMILLYTIANVIIFW